MRAVPQWAAFVGSKAALRELADSLRAEEAGNGVRVTTVYPAATATERLRSIRAAFGRSYEPARCIQPASLAQMIAWVLAAPDDSYVTELSVHPRHARDIRSDQLLSQNSRAPPLRGSAPAHAFSVSL
jgi:NADP-dependent 3-hydroxy acid dehydrogenase YdfG